MNTELIKSCQPILWSCSKKASVVLLKKIFNKKMHFKSWFKLLNRARLSGVRLIYIDVVFLHFIFTIFFTSFHIFISQSWSNGQITWNIILYYLWYLNTIKFIHQNCVQRLFLNRSKKMGWACLFEIKLIDEAIMLHFNEVLKGRCL